jgi:hypothetical protein
LKNHSLCLLYKTTRIIYVTTHIINQINVAVVGFITHDNNSFDFKTGLRPFIIRYIEKIVIISDTYTGTQCLAASHLFSLSNIVFLTDIYNKTDITHQIISDIIQLATISHILSQYTIDAHSATNHAHINHHIIEFVVEIGALKKVAIFNHNAAHNKVESIININSLESLIKL